MNELLNMRRRYACLALVLLLLGVFSLVIPGLGDWRAPVVTAFVSFGFSVLIPVLMIA